MDSNRKHDSVFLGKASRPVIVSMFINLVLAITKGVAAFFGNSNALMADAAESLSDVMSSIIVWIGIRTAVKEPDHDHPYGHGKAEPIASIIVVIFLLITSIAIASRALGRLWSPPPVPEAFTLYVLVAVIAIKELAYRYMRKKAKNFGSSALLAEALHNRSDAITSLMALLGILFAVVGGPKFVSADAYASLVASGIIAFNAVRIFRPAFNELMDAAPPVELNEQVKAISVKVPGVIEVEKCFLRKMGMQYLADMHVVVDGKMSVSAGHAIAHHVKDAILNEMPIIVDVLIHIEPDVLGEYNHI
ncbi:MAG TPA: cation diffusion facilitator family transporter [Bacteroidia bacterium]|jgi:cation diffusion facilitator family transporter|nr:cation diffusion facilitator family transporter [Bacteroidia bacterium]